MSLSRIAIRLALFVLVLLSLHANGTTADKPLIAEYHGSETALPTGETSDQGGIKEIIPAKYASAI